MIIETKLEFNSFIKKYQNSDCILISVVSDVNKHPLQNKLCLIYIKILDGDEYLLSFNHSESLNLSTEFVSLLNELGKKYTYDKKHPVDARDHRPCPAKPASGP